MQRGILKCKVSVRFRYKRIRLKISHARPDQAHSLASHNHLARGLDGQDGRVPAADRYVGTCPVPGCWRHLSDLHL